MTITVFYISGEVHMKIFYVMTVHINATLFSWKHLFYNIHIEYTT